MSYSPELEQPDDLERVAIDRRRLLRGASATAVAGALALGSVAAGAHGAPAVLTAMDNEALLRISEGLAGGGSLGADALPTLMGLIGDDPALAELASLTSFTPESIAASSLAARQLATNILQFWYLGQWDGQPVDGRSGMYFSLVAWQTLPYATQPTLCKGFAYWATEVDV